MIKLAAIASLVALSVIVQNSSKDNPPAKAGDAKGPIPYTANSIARGRQFYLIHCAACHDQDGRGLGRRDFNGTPPADLTDPDAWQHGTSPQAIFSSIRNGTKDDMPAFKDKLDDEKIWHMVNFVRSFWPESKRPKLETVPDPK